MTVPAKLALVLAVLALPHGSSPAETKVPVLVELFTSEGCSSCPAADAMLLRLLRTQPFDGVELIALGEHVDYWDSGGWRDRFSSRQFTLRQEGYSGRIGGGRIYTPQAVVGGRIDVLGSDEAGLRKALAKTRSGTSGTIVLRWGASDADGIALRVEVSSLPTHDGSDIWIALAEDGLVSRVTGGENAGRTLEHAAVVRTLARIGETAGASFSAGQRLVLDSAWKRPALRAVAFVQERSTGRVLAARTLTVQ